ncbi:hypothetical protein [Streptomyces sp. NPDC017958]
MTERGEQIGNHGAADFLLDVIVRSEEDPEAVTAIELPLTVAVD